MEINYQKIKINHLQNICGNLVVVSFCLYNYKKKNKKLNISALILKGGISKLIDRITNEGKVIDFIVIGFSKLHTGIFNLADLYITT